MAPKSEKLKEVEALQAQSRELNRGTSPPPPLSPQLSAAPSYRSSLDDGERILESELPSGKEAVEYAFYYTKSHTHMIICSGTTARKTPLYFSEVSEFTYKKIDVQLHQIPDDLAATIPIGSDLTTKQGIAGPIVGIARFPSFSRDFAIGFGDPDNSESEVLWEQVKNAQVIKHGQYDFFHTNPSGGAASQPIKYSWHRTHAEEDGLTGSAWSRKLNMNCWKLVDHNTGKVVALVTAKLFKKWSKAGQMRIYGGAEQNLELAIILSFSAIAEKARRREWKRRMAAASGGGGGGGGGG